MARNQNDEAPGRLSSVATAIRLLKAFNEDEVEIGISTLSKRLGIAKSTVHRLAVTLVSEGLLEQDSESGKYRLGIALFRLGALVRRRMNVSGEARPYLFQLRAKTDETVHLAILDGSDIMYVYDLESSQAIRMRSDLGGRKPAYCTAEGQAILAFEPPEVVERVIAKGLPPRTPQTLTTADGLRRALEAVRQRHRGRGERARHALHRRADPRRQRRGDRGGRAGRTGDAAVQEDGGGLRAACDRDRGSDLDAARVSGRNAEGELSSSRPSWPGLTRPSRLGGHCASLSEITGSR
jgi:IclR family KDG regulon transcriptional repressor